MQSGSNDLCRIDDAGLDQVAVLVLVGVETIVLSLHPADPIDDHRTILARVFGDASQRIVEHFADNHRAQCFVAFQIEFIQSLLGANQSDATACYDPFLKGCLGRRFGVFQQRFAFLHFGLGRSAAVDLRHAASQFRQAFLQLLAIVIAVSRLHLPADLVSAALDSRLIARTSDDDRIVRRHFDFLDLAKIR